MKASVHVRLLLAMAALAFMGCQDSIPGIAPEPLPQATVTEFGSPDELPAMYRWSSLTPEESLDGLSQLNEGMAVIKVAVRKAETWQQAHERATEAVAARPGLVQHYLAQIAALEMLHTWLLDGEVNAERTVTLAAHAEVLVHNNSPMAEPVYAALNRLETHWSLEKRQAAAHRAASAAEARIEEKRLRCSGCGPALQVPLPDVMEEGHNAYLHRTAAAVFQLRSLAND